ncbi:MAG: ATP-binding protein [Defluviitaleaceae bacterium]|nr:ATP-binding protein [Defluviitaleaceae bacterium]
MKNINAFKECLREYEKDREEAANLLLKRREQVYSKLPRVKEIEVLVNSYAIEIIKLSMSKNAEKANELKELIKNLEAEKKALLESANISHDYFETIYKCQNCKDTGFVVAERCPCLSQRLIEKYYETCNIKNVFDKENFDTFDIRYYSEEESKADGISPKTKAKMIYRLARDFVTNFDKEFSNLLFYGSPGLGKTFTCNCIAKEILDKGNTVLYVTAPTLFKTIEEIRFNRSDVENPKELSEMFTTVDLLIIDDLGTEFSTIVTQTELFSIINTRLLANLSTIISTNLSPDELRDNYSDRLVSRIFGNYEFQKFIGRDIRELKRYM